MTFLEFCTAFCKRIWSERSILLLVRSANQKVDESRRKPCEGEFRPVTEKNIGDCAQFEDADTRVPVYREMLENGYMMRFGYLNGKCVFRHAAQCSGDVTFDGCTILTLGEHEISPCYSYCAPEARGKGFHAESIYRMAQEFPDCTSYTMVLPTNKSSLKGYYRNGYEPLALLTVKKRFFKRQLLRKDFTCEEAKGYYC